MKFKKILENIKANNPNKKICVVIGNPVEHSLSPIMHGEGYKSLKIENKFVFDKICVAEEDLENFMADLKEFNRKENLVVGITCTMPHKQKIIPFLDLLQDNAKKIDAVNTVSYENGKYIGYNTDWYGIEQPFNEKKINLENKKVAIIGAGGASRAAVYTFVKNNSEVEIFNRTEEKAIDLAKEFNCSGYSLENTDRIKKADIVINTTSVGMGENKDESPINIEILNKDQVVFDCIYKPKNTKLLSYAQKVGAEIIYGWEMLLFQGVMQFEIYTGQRPVLENMKRVLL